MNAKQLAAQRSFLPFCLWSTDSTQQKSGIDAQSNAACKRHVTWSMVSNTVVAKL